VHPVFATFAPVLGSPSWQVEKGHGSFVTLEFGEPQLTVREPCEQLVFIDGAPPRALLRTTWVRGPWHLWIYCCEWSLALGAALLAHNESSDAAIGRALRVLNGQALTAVAVSAVDGSTTFTFDLGCLLSTRPAPDGAYGHEPVQQWMFYQPNGDVLTVRGDGHYSLHGAKQSLDTTVWQPLPVSALHRIVKMPRA
jgi:hypothetical protein